MQLQGHLLIISHRLKPDSPMRHQSFLILMPIQQADKARPYILLKSIISIILPLHKVVMTLWALQMDMAIDHRRKVRLMKSRLQTTPPRERKRQL